MTGFVSWISISAPLGWRAYDVATFLYNIRETVPAHLHDDIWRCFLEGYNRVRPLTQLEMDCLPVLANAWTSGISARRWCCPRCGADTGRTWLKEISHRMSISTRRLNPCGNALGGPHDYMA